MATAVRATPDPFVDYGFGGAIVNTECHPSMSPTAASATTRPSAAITPPPPGPTLSGSAVPRGVLFTMRLEAAATFAGCTFDHNQAIGGNGNSGSGPVVLVGEGLGGAIVSGYGGDRLRPEHAHRQQQHPHPERCPGRRQQHRHRQRGGPCRRRGRRRHCQLRGRYGQRQRQRTGPQSGQRRPPATRPAAPGPSSPVSARAAASSITWGITTPPASGS